MDHKPIFIRRVEFWNAVTRLEEKVKLREIDVFKLAADGYLKFERIPTGCSTYEPVPAWEFEIVIVANQCGLFGVGLHDVEIAEDELNGFIQQYCLDNKAEASKGPAKKSLTDQQVIEAATNVIKSGRLKEWPGAIRNGKWNISEIARYLVTTKGSDFLNATGAPSDIEVKTICNILQKYRNELPAPPKNK